MAPRVKAVPVPPDGGWGWVVVACSFVNQLFCVGTVMSLGILYIFWLDEFKESKGMTSWILSAAFFVMCVIGPIPASLAHRFGFKLVTVVGGLLMALGFSLSYFATSIGYLIGTVGILAGTGMAFVYLSTFATVALYFEKRRTLANGIGTSGAGIGSFIMPLLLKELEKSYGWRSAMLVLGALTLHVCAAGLLLTPFVEETSKSCYDPFDEKDKKLHHNHDGVSLCDDSDASECDFKHSHTDIDASDVLQCDLENDSQEKFEVASDKDEEELKENLMMNTTETDCMVERKSSAQNSKTSINAVEGIKASRVDKDYCEARLFNQLEENIIHRHKQSKAELAKHGANTSVNQFGSAPHLPNKRTATSNPNHRSIFSSINEMRLNRLRHEYNANQDHPEMDPSSVALTRSLQSLDSTVLGSMPSLIKRLYHYTPVDNEDMSSELPPKDCSTYSPEYDDLDMKSSASSTFLQDFSQYFILLRNKRFLIFGTSSLLINWAVTITLVYMADRAVNEGLSTSTGALIMSFNGIGNVIGRLFFGLVADRFFHDYVICYILILSILGVATLLSPLCGTYAPLHCLFATIFGATLGGNVILMVSVVVTLMGLEQMTFALGLNLVFVGIGDLIGPPVGGLLYDRTQSYLWSFLMSGILLVISASILIPLRKK